MFDTGAPLPPAESDDAPGEPGQPRLAFAIKGAVIVPGSAVPVRVHPDAMAPRPRGQPRPETVLAKLQAVVQQCAACTYAYTQALCCANEECGRTHTLVRIRDVDDYEQFAPAYSLCLRCGRSHGGTMRQKVAPEEKVDPASVLQSNINLNLLFCIQQLNKLADEFAASGAKHAQPVFYAESAAAPAAVAANTPVPVPAFSVLDDKALGKQQAAYCDGVLVGAITPVPSEAEKKWRARAKILTQIIGKPGCEVRTERQVRAYLLDVSEEELIHREEKFYLASEELVRPFTPLEQLTRDIMAELPEVSDTHRSNAPSVPAAGAFGFPMHLVAPQPVPEDASSGIRVIPDEDDGEDAAAPAPVPAPVPAQAQARGNLFGDPPPAAAQAVGVALIPTTTKPEAAERSATAVITPAPEAAPAALAPPAAPKKPGRPRKPKAVAPAPVPHVPGPDALIPVVPGLGAGKVWEDQDQDPDAADDFVWVPPPPRAPVDTVAVSYVPSPQELDIRRVLGDLADADLGSQWETVKKRPFPGEFDRARVIGDLARSFAGRTS